MDYKDKICFEKRLMRLDGTYDKKELYRILTIAEKLGIEWSSRTMYGGGTSITVYEKYDEVAIVSIYDNNINVSLDEDYFEEDFKPSEIRYYNEETQAERDNESALYGYELPHYYIVKGKDL